MKKTIQRKYARLIARVGANIQKGQTVRLFINADQYEFATILVDECYKAGASRVDIDWSWQPITKLNYRYRSLKSLSAVLKWEEERLKLMKKMAEFHVTSSPLKSLMRKLLVTSSISL